MPDYPTKDLPSPFMFMLVRSWIFAVGFLMAIPLWKIFHLSMFVTLGTGAVLYGVIVGVGALYIKVPAGNHWLKLSFLEIPMLICFIGFTGISYGMYGNCYLTRLIVMAGIVIWLFLHIVKISMMLGKSVQ